MPFTERGHVKITIRLSSRLTSADQAAAVLGRVFAVTQEDIVNSVPPFWRAYLTKQIGVAQSLKKGELQSVAARHQPPNDAGDGSATTAEKVFTLGEGRITAPKVVSAPEPEFTAAARDQNFGGLVGLNVVIDETGRVSNVSIVKPLGLGLDENAANTVARWKFTPGMREGQPVAVAVYVEVEFHLGWR